MLADDSNVFDKVIVVASNMKNRDLIEEALLPFRLKTKVEVVVLSQRLLAEGPAVTLNAALVGELVHGDFDVTIFLSDMLPANAVSAGSVYTMNPDTWGVVEKPDGDFKRWCMVKEDDVMQIEDFFDKPQVQPPTRLAANGVYRYAQASRLVKAYDIYMGIYHNIGDEVQFSDVARSYNRKWPLSTLLFDRHELVDFGTLEEYQRNRGISRCRSFNHITDDGDSVTKSSEQFDKIKDEIVWLTNVPERLRKFVPSVYDHDLMYGRYTMEKIRSQNLRDVALYFDRSYDTWREVFTKVQDFLAYTASTAIPPFGGACSGNAPFWDKIRKKTEERMGQITGIELDRNKTASWVYGEFEDCIDALKEMSSDEYGEDPVIYYHGDLHFANMFYCFHYGDLKVVDPRGEVRGSIYYDFAKLCHSVYGRYDYIDAELYTLDANGEPLFYDLGHSEIERAFNDVIFNKLTRPEQKVVLTITASLFLSMIPLHKDRPKNCELFYKEYERIAAMAAAIDTEE